MTASTSTHHAPEQLPGEAMAGHHEMSRWVDMVLIGVGAWLVASPVTVGYQQLGLIWSDIASGLAIAVFAALSLWQRRPWAPYAAAGVGTWLLFAPVVFWAEESGAYLNDTMVGAVVITLAVLIPHSMEMPGGQIPPGWSYNPSTWRQRIPIIILALIGFFASRYMAAFQLDHIGFGVGSLLRQGN